MEGSMKMRMVAVAMMAIVSAAAAAEAPAPSPTSGASTAAPAAVIASLTALAFGFFLHWIWDCCLLTYCCCAYIVGVWWFDHSRSCYSLLFYGTSDSLSVIYLCFMWGFILLWKFFLALLIYGSISLFECLMASISFGLFDNSVVEIWELYYPISQSCMLYG